MCRIPLATPVRRYSLEKQNVQNSLPCPHLAPIGRIKKQWSKRTPPPPTETSTPPEKNESASSKKEVPPRSPVAAGGGGPTTNTQFWRRLPQQGGGGGGFENWQGIRDGGEGGYEKREVDEERALQVFLCFMCIEDDSTPSVNTRPRGCCVDIS